MEQIVLRASDREDSGTSAARALRANGRVPAVIYGHGKPTRHISVSDLDFARFLSHGAATSIVTLSFDGGSSDQEDVTVMIKEVQKHPVKGRILHADFLEVLMTDQVTLEVPIVTTGGVQTDGGVLEHALSQVEISVLASAIPSSLELDIDGMGIGDSRRVSDIEVPEGVEILADAEQLVVSISAPRMAEEDEAEEDEAEEGAEPELVGEEDDQEDTDE